MASTPNLGLILPAAGTLNWTGTMNENLTEIDTAVGTLRASVEAVTTPVASVFGRTGAVSAQNGDYSFSEISGTVGVSQLPQIPAADITGVLPIANGGTGATIGVDALENLGGQPIGEKGQPNGYASLDANGMLPSSQLPSLAIDHTFVVATQAAMLALAANVGDIAIRSDINDTFILQALPAATLANWIQVLTPSSPVQSVNGKVGNVSLTASDVGAAASGANSDITSTGALATIKVPTGQVLNIVPTAGDPIPARVLVGASGTAQTLISNGVSGTTSAGAATWGITSSTGAALFSTLNFLSGGATVSGILGNGAKLSSVSGVFINGNLRMTATDGSGTEVDAGIEAAILPLLNLPNTWQGPNVFTSTVLFSGSTATSSTNFDSSPVQISGSFWNGISAVGSVWTFIDLVGAGTSPSCTLKISHVNGGSASINVDNSVDMLSFTDDGDVPQIQIGTKVPLTDSAFGIQVGSSAGENTQIGWNGAFGWNTGANTWRIETSNGAATFSSIMMADTANGHTYRLQISNGAIALTQVS